MLNIHNSIHKSSIEHFSPMKFMYCVWLKGILKPFKKHNRLMNTLCIILLYVPSPSLLGTNLLRIYYFVHSMTV